MTPRLPPSPGQFSVFGGSGGGLYNTLERPRPHEVECEAQRSSALRSGSLRVGFLEYQLSTMLAGKVLFGYALTVQCLSFYILRLFCCLFAELIPTYTHFVDM